MKKMFTKKSTKTCTFGRGLPAWERVQNHRMLSMKEIPQSTCE